MIKINPEAESQAYLGSEILHSLYLNLNVWSLMGWDSCLLKKVFLLNHVPLNQFIFYSKLSCAFTQFRHTKTKTLLYNPNLSHGINIT